MASADSACERSSKFNERLVLRDVVLDAFFSFVMPSSLGFGLVNRTTWSRVRAVSYRPQGEAASMIMDRQTPLPAGRVLLFCSLSVIGCAADLCTKYLVFRHPELYHGSEWWLWEGHIGIQKSLNEGALGGIGQGGVALFALFAAVAAIAIPVWLFRFDAARDLRLTIALGCIMGGILGNLYDRLGFPQLTWDRFDPARAGEPVRAVRDWILWQWNPQWVWPNFNIADALLVCGAVLLLLQGFRGGPTQALSDDKQTAKKNKKL